MVVYSGESVQLSIGDGASPVQSFFPLGGVQLSALQLQQQPVEDQAIQSDGWRRLKASAGQRALAISGQGVIDNIPAHTRLRSQAFAGQATDFELHFANGDKVAGLFIITLYALEGAFAEAEQFRIALENAGAVSLTPA